MTLKPNKAAHTFIVIMLFAVNLAAQTHTQTIEAWRQKRTTNLKAENGWLNLAGLFWLHPGKNTFGSDSTNDLVFPKGRIAGKAGILVWQDKEVWLETAAGTITTLNGKAIQKEMIYHQDSSGIKTLASGPLRFYIIRRENKIGVRLRDLSSPNVLNFKGIENFPIDSTWRVPAQFVPTPAGNKIPITNVLGQTAPQASPGKIVFQIAGNSYSLDALEEDDTADLFILFGDVTNKENTYPSGRFIYVKKPKPGEQTMIDFNTAYSPPCAYTPYATCPLPPRQNILPIEIRAGEKYRHHE